MASLVVCSEFRLSVWVSCCVACVLRAAAQVLRRAGPVGEDRPAVSGRTGSPAAEFGCSVWPPVSFRRAARPCANPFGISGRIGRSLAYMRYPPRRTHFVSQWPCECWVRPGESSWVRCLVRRCPVLCLCLVSLGDLLQFPSHENPPGAAAGVRHLKEGASLCSR